MAAIEKAINDFFNSGSLKAAVYRGNAIFGFSSKVDSLGKYLDFLYLFRNLYFQKLTIFMKVLASAAFVCWMTTAFLNPVVG